MATEAKTRERKVTRLDFAQYLKGNEQDKEKFCVSLVDACRNEGFVKLRNHGIEKDIEEVFEWVSVLSSPR